MPSLVHWGITFRSYSHWMWFRMSMWLFVVSWAYYFFALFLSKKFSGPASARVGLWRYLLFFHSVTSIEAIAVAAGKYLTHHPVNGAMYSIDCIWFNALMAVCYFFLRRLAAKPEKPFCEDKSSLVVAG